MTIWNEAARLFFAVSALVIVGLLSAEIGGISDQPIELKEETAAVQIKAKPEKSKSSSRVADRKQSKKIILKKS